MVSPLCCDGHCYPAVDFAAFWGAGGACSGLRHRHDQTRHHEDPQARKGTLLMLLMLAGGSHDGQASLTPGGARGVEEMYDDAQHDASRNWCFGEM